MKEEDDEGKFLVGTAVCKKIQKQERTYGIVRRTASSCAQRSGETKESKWGR